MTDSKQYFDDVSGRWDQMREQFFPASLREKACAMAEVEAGMTAADIGAGTGFVTEGLLTRGLKVTAVDQSAEMLRVLEEKLSGKGDLTCLEGTAEALPLAAGSVDRVFANMFLHHVEDPQAAVAEMVRILAPGGWLVITDLDSHVHEFLRVEQHDRWLGFDRDAVRDWFRAAGLVEVVIECAGAECCADAADGDTASVSIFAARGQKP